MKEKLKLIDEAIYAWKKGELTDHTAFIAIHLIVVPQDVCKEAIKWAEKAASQQTIMSLSKMKIYVFEYNECYHESSFETIGLYFNKKDAYKAMRKKKFSEYDKWLEMKRVCGKFGNDKIPGWTLYRIRARYVT